MPRRNALTFSPVVVSLCLNAVVAGGLWLAYVSTLGTPPLVTWLVVVNLQLLVLLGKDKLAANQAWPRTPEITLYMLALAGGTPALLLGRVLFRHKTKKAGFIAGMVGLIAVQVGVAGWWIFNHASFAP